jgi:phosphoribosylanthranilate isomerase
VSETSVKICGLKTPQDVQSVAEAGARFAGFVFFEKSPRYVTIDAARVAALSAPVGLAKVALVVNATDAYLDAIVENVPLDILQLHGSEATERVQEIKARYGLPVMKAVGIRGQEDLRQLDLYNRVADMILVDAKPPKDAVLPGGNGLAFDWGLIAGRRWPIPWMLAGGLTPQNAALAVQKTGAKVLDVSSGVECAPGVKDYDLVRDFVNAAQNPIPDLK